MAKNNTFKNIGKELGATGTENIGGVLNVEYNSDLQFPQSIEVYDKMRRSDGTVRAVLKACKEPLMSAKYSVVPASEEKKDIEIAEYIEKCLFEKIVWRKFLRNWLLACDFGFSLFEKVYGVDEKGMIYVRKFAERLPESIEKWEQDDGSEGVTQNAYISGKLERISIPKEKLLHFAVDQEGGNLEGISLLRAGYKHWFFKELLYKLQGMAAERCSIGIPTANIPENRELTKKEEQEITTTLKKLIGGDDAYILNKGGIEISFTTPEKGTFDFEQAINHHDRQITKSVLAAFLEIGVTKGGNAQNDSQQDLFFLSLQGMAEEMCEKINRDIIQQLVLWNFGEQEKYPKLQVSEVGTDKMASFADILQKLAVRGLITPDHALEGQIRKMMKLPEKEEEGKQGDHKGTPLRKKTDSKNPDKKIEEDAKKKKEEEKKSKKLSENFACSCGDNSENFSEEKISRFLTLAEEKIDIPAFREFFEKQEKSVLKILESHSEVLQKKILSELKNKLEKGEKISVSPKIWSDDVKKISGEIEKKYLESYEFGKTQAGREMGKTARVVTPAAEKQYIKEYSESVAHKHAEDLRNEAVFVVQEQKRIAAETASALVLAKKAMATKSASQLRLLTPILMSGGVNRGRTIVFDEYEDDIWGYQYSAILDSKTSNLCLALDGKVSRNKKDIPDPPLHFNCRSIRVQILHDEKEKPKEDKPSETMRKNWEGKKWPYSQPKEPETTPTTPAGRQAKKNENK